MFGVISKDKAQRDRVAATLVDIQVENQQASFPTHWIIVAEFSTGPLAGRTIVMDSAPQELDKLKAQVAEAEGVIAREIPPIR